jgi:hypothetical protein
MEGDDLHLGNVMKAVDTEQETTQLTLVNETRGDEIPVELDASAREREYVVAGGKLNHTKQNA